MSYSWSRGFGGAVRVGRRCWGFDKEGIEVPLPLCGGQGQVMCTREHDGLSGMACVHGSPGVQGNLAVTLNQNRCLPFERLEGRMRSERINTRVASDVLQSLRAC